MSADAPADTWVLLRGLTRESGHWGAFVPHLARALPPGTALLTPDLPGNGALHHLDSPDRVEAMVETLRAGLLAGGVPPPYHLLAMSLGAMVAVAWAQAYPRELRGAVLINTSLRPFSPFWRRLRPAQYPRVLRLALRPPTEPLLWEQAILAMTTRHPPDPAATLAHWVVLRRRHPVSHANAWRQLLAATRFKAGRAAPTVPMLVLHSAADALVHPACSAAVARHWNLPIRQHPSAGHDLPLDDPAWVARQVGDWLARSTP